MRREKMLIAVIAPNRHVFDAYKSKCKHVIAVNRQMVKGQDYVAWRIESGEQALGRRFDSIILLPGWQSIPGIDLMLRDIELCPVDEGIAA
jgi:hypothetical protein